MLIKQNTLPSKMPSQSHFIWIYKLKAMQETKMENIAAVKCLAVQKAYFYLCHATQVTTNIFCSLSSLLEGKKSGWSLPLCHTCQLLMENLNCHNKVFFQDLSSNSLSFLLKWLLRARVSHKSRVGIVIQNRWTLNHRWCWDGAKQSLLLRGEGKGKGGKNSLHPFEKHQMPLCSRTWALVPLSQKYQYSLKLYVLFSRHALWTLCFWFLVRWDRGLYLLYCWGESWAWVLIDCYLVALVLFCKHCSLTPVRTSWRWPAELRRGCWVNKLSP